MSNLSVLRTAFTNSAKLQEKYDNGNWWSCRPLLDFRWARYLVVNGARETGKTVDIIDFWLEQFFKYENVKFWWLRLTPQSTKKLLENGGIKAIDPVLWERYKLNTPGREIKVKKKSGEIYIGERLFCRIVALSETHHYTGSAQYDATFKGWIYILIDEFNRHSTEKNTFVIADAFTNMLENILRSRKEKWRCFMAGNIIKDGAELLFQLFNFCPLDFGTYKLKKNKCVIEYMPITEAYKERRKGSHSDLTEYAKEMSAYTNRIQHSMKYIYKGRRQRPTELIKFPDGERNWFTIWDGNIIHSWNKENVPAVAMRNHLEELYTPARAKSIIETYQVEGFKFTSMSVQMHFKNLLEVHNNVK